MMHTIGIMQPYFFPYIGYFQLIKAVDTFIIYDDVTYIKQGWINRNAILINNERKGITIPLKEAGSHKWIKDIQMMDNHWRTKLLQSIKLAYGRAPQFAVIFPFLEDLILYPEQNLSVYLRHIITSLTDYLQINTPIISTSTIYQNNHLKNIDRVLDICRLEKADRYINAIGGKALYPHERFSEQHMVLKFIQTPSLVYTQFKEPFIPYLSIIDVLMFCSVEEVIHLLDNYQLID